MDSATLRQEVSQAASEIGAAKQALTFAVMEENNTDDPQKKGLLGNKIEQLKGNIEGAASRHGSVVADLRIAEGAERKEKLTQETERQKSEQLTIEKEAATAKNIEKELEYKDKKPTIVKKDLKSAGDFSDYERTGVDPKDIDAKQMAILKQAQEFAKGVCVQVKEPHKDDVKDKPAVAANVSAASAAPAIATAGSTGITQDNSTPTAASKIQGTAGASGTNV